MAPTSSTSSKGLFTSQSSNSAWGLKAKPGGLGHSTTSTSIEIDGDDDGVEELDELVLDSVPCSSPYFTQPTQIVGRATQPTQIVNRPTLRAPSSPLVPNSPSTIIEVPASSPFQPKSLARVSATPEKRPGVAGRVGSLMAPAGTSFRPPTAQKAPRPSNGSKGQKDYLEISDDELLEDYKKHHSSDDDTPTRGDIRPSSFVKKPSPQLASKPRATWSDKRDIALSDIRDIRLRHLTSQVYKIARKMIPEITIRASKEALQKDVSWNVSKAVDILMGVTPKPLPSSKSANAPSTSSSRTTNNANGTESNPISLRDEGRAAGSTQKNLHSFLKDPKSTTANSIQSLHKSNPNRRRLVQKSQDSPASSAVFSQPSSSNSSITTPTDSITETMKSPRSPSPEAPPQPRRRLMQGRRHRTPPPSLPPTNTISLLSDSDSDSTTRLSRKRRTNLKAGPPKKEGSRKRESENPDLASSPNKKAKLETGESFSTTSSPKTDSADSKKQNAMVYEPSLNSEGGEEFGTPDSQHSSEENSNVLQYLNTCTADSLGRMIGSPVDARLMVSARPFKTISDAENVSKQDKSKSKKHKTRNVMIGGAIVEQLTTWLEACEAATAIIDECDNRGTDIRSTMADWSMDGNGILKKGSDSLVELPITKKPALMSEEIQLKSYQLVGLNWMNLLHSKGYSGILADDMGLGKTCQVISFIAHLVESKREPNTPKPWPNLVVVPPSTYENWLSEFEKFAPDIKVLAYSGKSRREISTSDARKHHVVLTTYSQVEKQQEDLRWLQLLNPHAAIFDEGHRLKNSKTLIYNQMMRVPSDWRLVISGTPVQNNLKELLALLRFIEPSLFEADSLETLHTIFETKVTSKDVLNFAALASERVDRARAVMAPFILQRRKDDVIELPSKTERLEIVGMHEVQKQIYDSIKGKYLLENGVNAKESHPWMQLKKAAIHHQLFRHHFTDDKVKKMVDILWDRCSEEELYVQEKNERFKVRFEKELMEKSDFELHLECKEFKKYIGQFDIPKGSWEESPKVKRFLELVRRYMENGDRVLVFSRFQMVVDILQETLDHADIPFCLFTGRTDTAGRFPECQRFTDNPEIPVFLMTTQSGGTGLNLVAANKIIIFDQSDNPQEDVQASNRAHRIGQTRDVEVIKLITDKSIEGLIYNSCVKKLVLASRVERQFDAVDEDQESVMDECRRRMLLGDDEAEIADVAPPTQQA